MNKFTYHEQLMGLDPSTTMNYNINELMKGIIENMDKIALAVMGKEVYGAHFVSVHPDDESLLVCHGTMTKVAYVGIDPDNAPKDNFLWVMIDKIEAAYRARFLTPECLTRFEREDVTPREELYKAQRTKDEEMRKLYSQAVTAAYKSGIKLGIAYSILVLSLILFAIYFVI